HVPQLGDAPTHRLAPQVRRRVLAGSITARRVHARQPSTCDGRGAATGRTTSNAIARSDAAVSTGPTATAGGYWGKQGPEFLDRRLAVMSEDQRLVLGATTF